MPLMADANSENLAHPVISIVTPAFNEAENLEPLYRRLCSVMEAADIGWEWIAVDDHSADSTFDLLSQLAARDGRVLGLRFARNVGSHAAILCGLAHTRGGAAIVLAADGEDPPEEIPRLIAEWRNGAAVVWAERRSLQGRSAYEQLASRVFHRLIRRWSNLDNLAPAGSDFFLVSRPVINIVNTLGERNTNVMALLAWIGFDHVSLAYEKAPRAAGRTGWTTAKKLKLLFDSVFGFSLRPVRAMSMVGFVTATLGFLYAGVVVINAAFGKPVEGWSSLMVVVLVLGGIQMIMLGILGEYLWRALDESRSRPRYVVERRTDDL
jgi:polyisoprenyl-phosphate glycosyltransferase